MSTTAPQNPDTDLNAVAAEPDAATVAARKARFDAFTEVRAIVEEMRGVKLHEPEADAINWAAEGMLLSQPGSEDAADSQQAFTTLLTDLTAHRWKEMSGTATKLRDAFDRCGG